eukprot:11190275-Lingulodinium_polyedra.AAC.1
MAAAAARTLEYYAAAAARAPPRRLRREVLWFRLRLRNVFPDWCRLPRTVSGLIYHATGAAVRE